MGLQLTQASGRQASFSYPASPSALENVNDVERQDSSGELKARPQPAQGWVGERPGIQNGRRYHKQEIWYRQ